MTDLLVNHALKNVWCAPDQDNQIIFQLARLTPYNGVSVGWKVLMTSLVVPEVGKRFHLFQIGQVHPVLTNLFPRLNEWMRISDSCMLSQTLCDLYLSNGVRLNCTECWYIVTEERNVIVAVKETRQLGLMPTAGLTAWSNLATQTVYMRVYRNAYFASQRWIDFQTSILPVTIARPIDIEGGTIESTEALLSLQVRYMNKAALPGKVFVYKNGYRIKEISLLTCAVGDLVEYVYDASVYEVKQFPIRDLQTFNSVLDQKGKYLLPHTGYDLDTIDYQDDIDCYLINRTTEQGVYYHKNAIDTLRMVTHVDYATPVAQVRAFLDQYPSLLALSQVDLELCVRRSGYRRTLVDEHHRIKELYKLPTEQRVSAMVGLDANVQVWKAAELENSSYAAVMRQDYMNVTKALAVDMLGYNAVAKVAGQPLVRTSMINSFLAAEVPHLYQSDATGFEYDADGKLLAWTYHAQGDTYHCSMPTSAYVEFVKGVCDERIDDYLNVTGLTLNSQYDYRFYIRERMTNPQHNTWVDVTGDTSKYLVTSGAAVWSSIKNTHDTLIRSNQKVLLLNKTLPMTDGLLVFNLTEKRLVNGSLVEKVMEVPMGELDIFLNQKSLIENLDYFIQYPMVTIVNKQHLKPTGDQQVVIRFKGLCQADLSLTDANEFGFVNQGRFSVDRQYDIRDDKCIKLIVGGALKLPSDCVFNEDTHSFEMVNVLNGTPYLVKDLVVPMKTLTGLDTYTYRQSSLAVDAQISDYLTVKLGAPEAQGTNPIGAYYTVYSPMLAKIAMDMKSGVLNDPVMRGQYNDNQVIALLANYLYLFVTDPIHPDNRPDKRYVAIHPHHFSTVLDLDIYQYTFLNRVIRLYAKDVMVLSNHAQIV